MNLTTTEKYALAVLEAKSKLTALKKRELALYLAASCVWDMIQAESVCADKKGKLRISAPLPETLSYCRPIYERLAKKPMKPTKVPYDCIWMNKRIKTLLKSIADDLIGKSVLVVEQQNSLLESGTAKKLLNKQELSDLKKTEFRKNREMRCFI